MALDWTEDVLAGEADPWRCDYCGESYRFQTHPACLKKALAQRDAALVDLKGALQRLRLINFQTDWVEVVEIAHGWKEKP
jgi:ABC-type ATPase with predicted acetyltransferase domain